jgi:hypothetical protein
MANWSTDAEGRFVDLDGNPIRLRTVYTLNTDCRVNPWLKDPDRLEAFLRFTHAHGLKYRFEMTNGVITVKHHPDDTLWVHTRRMIGEAPNDIQPCPYCACCVKTEPYATPLVAPIPDPWNLDNMHLGFRERLIFTDAGHTRVSHGD